MKREEFIKSEYREYQHRTTGIDIWEEGAFRAGFEAALKLSLPPAEGAEEIEVTPPTDREITIAYSVLAYQHELSEDDVRIALSNYRQPIAEGAEEILTNLETYYDFKFHWVERDRMIRAMQEFATLHAQKIADKMVEERLREYHLNEGYDVVIVGNPDKEIDGDIFEDIKVAALELGELRGLKVMITGFYANYLKSRDSHE